MFGELQSCSLERIIENSLLIKNGESNYLITQYKESKYKIAFNMPKKICIGLYIAFPAGSLNEEELIKAVDPDNNL